ncbi:MAG: hypothetical protein V8S69_03430, partial [Dakarella massiliensis]
GLWFSCVCFRMTTFSRSPIGLNRDLTMEVLVFEPQEKAWGYCSFRFGGRIKTNFNDDNNFQFMLQHTLGWLNGCERGLKRTGGDGSVKRCLSQCSSITK